MTKHFSSWEVRKNVASFDDATKTFLLKNPKNSYFPQLHGQSIEQGSWIISKFGIDMSDLFGHVTGGLEWFLVQSQVFKKSWAKNDTDM